MIVEQLVYEEREVRDFNRVLLTGYGELQIHQGDTESLIVKSHPDTLPRILSEVIMGRLELGQGRSWKDKLNFALETSLTRKPIRYELTVKELAGLEMSGAVDVRVEGLSTDYLYLRASGPNHIQFESLAAELLEVELPVGGIVELDGLVTEQRVTINGPSNYQASRLKSNCASIKITGPSDAVVYVTDEFNVEIRGLGSVKYFGSPRVQKSIRGLGSLVKMNR